MLPRLAIWEQEKEIILPPRLKWAFAGIIEATNEEITELQRQGGCQIRDFRSTSISNLLQELINDRQPGKDRPLKIVLVDEALAEERVRAAETRVRALETVREELTRAVESARSWAKALESSAQESARALAIERNSRARAEKRANVAEECTKAVESAWAIAIKKREERARAQESARALAMKKRGERAKTVGMIVMGAIVLVAIVLVEFSC